MRPPVFPPEFCTWTMSDGYVLHGRRWHPAEPPRRTVLYLHGIQSHGGWFEWSASLLAAMGHAVILPDRRGSGLNKPYRGDVACAERWLADLDELTTWAHTTIGPQPLDVVGVSWGGKLAAAWALQRPDTVDRLLLIAPGVFPAVDIGAAGRLRVGWALLTEPTRELSIPLDDPALFTQNPEGRKFIESDPLKLTRVSARFLYQSARLDRQLRRATTGTLPDTTTAFLAGHDRIIRNPQTAKWLERITGGQAVIQWFSDAQHTLEFEHKSYLFASLLQDWVGGEIA